MRGRPSGGHSRINRDPRRNPQAFTRTAQLGPCEPCGKVVFLSRKAANQHRATLATLNVTLPPGLHLNPAPGDLASGKTMTDITVPLSPGYDTDGEGNAIEDDDPEHWQCDTCGEEFETRAAFEGHESENTHPEEPGDPDDDPPAFPDAVVSAFEDLPFAPEAHTLNHPGSDRWTGGDRKDER